MDSAPLAAALEQVEHSTEDLVQVDHGRLGSLAHALQQGQDDLEFLSTEVAGIVLSHGAILSKLELLSKIVNGFLGQTIGGVEREM